MTDQKQPIPFDLDKFKAGQKALTRDGRVATFIGICEQCKIDLKLIIVLKGHQWITSACLDGQFSTSSLEHPQDLIYMEQAK